MTLCAGGAGQAEAEPEGARHSGRVAGSPEGPRQQGQGEEAHP